MTAKNQDNKHVKFSVLAADIALMAFHDGKLWMRLFATHRIQQLPDSPSLPGGLVLPHETAEQAARRLLEVRGGVSTKHIHIEQLRTYSALARDPRGRVVSVGYIALVPWTELSDAERQDSKDMWWHDAADLSKLAFAYDHGDISADALRRLRAKIGYTTIASKLLPAEFTLSELQSLYEAILGKTLDKRNFRKKLLALDILKPLGKKVRGKRARPAELYSFASKKVEMIELL
jgi:8-oxo-dGTP diphosphatase